MRFAGLTGMSLSPKSRLFVNRFGNRRELTGLQVDGVDLPVARTFECLGVELRADGRPALQRTDERVAKAVARAPAVQLLPVSRRYKRLATQTFVTPAMNYGSGVAPPTGAAKRRGRSAMARAAGYRNELRCPKIVATIFTQGT